MSTAWSIISLEAFQSDTLVRLATASPPAAVISATTSSTPSPRSLRTRRAPSAAKSLAWAAPSPCPAPVMMATFPSSVPMSAFSCGW